MNSTITASRVVLVFILVFFTVFMVSEVTHPSVWSDETFYAWHAQEIAKNPLLVMGPMIWEYHPPLFTALAAPLAMFMPGLEAVRVLSLAIGILVLLFTYRLAARMFDKWTGVVAAGITAMTPIFFFITHFGLLDGLLTLGMLLTIMGIYHWNRTGSIIPLAVGLLVALWSKRGGFIALLVSMILTVRAIHQNSIPKTRKLILLHISMLILALFFYTLFKREKDIIFAGDWPSLFFSHFIGLVTLFAPLIPGIILFLAYRPKEHQYRGIFIVWILATGSLILYPRWDSRLFLPMLPALAILSACGLTVLARQGLVHRVVVGLFILAMMTSPAIMWFSILHDNVGLTGYAEAGAWIRENARDSVIYDAKDRETRYYSGIELAKWGGSIRFYPKEEKDFISEIQSEKRQVIGIIMDYDNPAAPDYPTDDFLVTNGFIKVAGFTQKGRNTETIRIYRYEPSHKDADD